MEESGYSSFEKVLETHGRLVYTTKGCSMLPLLREDRDLVLIDPRPTDKDGNPLRCRKYDTVLYKREDKYILHRVLKVLPQGYVIRGDNNYFCEYDIGDDQIIGVMVGFVRNGVETPVTNHRYRLYVRLRCGLFPLRAGVRRGKAMLSRIKRKCTARKK